ncbi:MAG: helix-turn-helix domain-containing protein [Planctomycetota bacterium]
MLAHALQRLINDERTSAKEIAELTGVSTSTVYRWIAGQSQPDFDSIRMLVRHLPNRDAQEAILGVFVQGTTWSAVCQEIELDVNHDGQIDAEDALDATIEAVKAAGQSLAAVRAAARSQRLNPDETLELIARLNTVVNRCTVTQRVLVELADQRRKRKINLAGLKLADG